MPQSLRLVLIKPSHYDNDGYVIQWFRSAMPSNTLAVLYGLALDCRDRQTLGPDVDIDITAIDETNTRVRVESLIRELRGRKSLVCLVGVQSNQYPRAMDLARRFRAADIPVSLGGFHVSGTLSMLPGIQPEVQEAMDMGISLFAGEAEGRFEQVLLDAWNGTLKPLYNYMDDLPSLTGVPSPLLPASRIKRTGGTMTSFDAGRGCPFQCSFCTIINVQGRKSRRRTPEEIEQIVRRNLAQGINRFFITDDNFARNTDWEKVFDRLIHLRENEKANIKFIIQVDTMCHRLPHFIEKAGRAGVARVFIGLESINPESLKSAKKKQNKIAEYRKMLLEWKKAHVTVFAGYILGFPGETPETIRRDIEVIRRELPIDLLEFHCLTPLPGSEDHQKLFKEGAYLDPDLNKYDLEHVVAKHSNMSIPEWRRAYDEAWDIFYAPEHIRTVMRRAAATGINAGNMMFLLLWYWTCEKLEKVHPLQGGYLRRKYRKDRRPTMTVESPLVFYPRYVGELVWKHLRLAGQIVRFGRFRYQLKRDPESKNYRDVALTPVLEEDVTTLELLRVLNNPRRKKPESARKLSAFFQYNLDVPSLKSLPTLVLVALCATAQTAPDQVTVEVAATDKSGFTKSLSAPDFKLWEDNKEQTVASAVVRPPGKHAIVLLFDNTTVSVRIQSDVRGYVEHFIDAAAGPRNYMEVASFFSAIRVLQPFTTDAALLKSSLTDTQATAVLNSGNLGNPVNNDPSVTMGKPTGAKVRNGSALSNGNGTADNEMKTESMMESFRGLVESLAPIRGRKAIVLFSGGQSFSQEVTKYVDRVLDEANKDNVAIYGIAASADNSGIAFVKTFADATGGTSIKQTPNLPDALKQILEEQDEYYAVTFTPNNAGDPAGVCHQLRVKVETPGVEARSRKSYCAKNADALAGTPAGKELETRLAGTAAGNLGASLQTPYFYGESNTQAGVTVVLDTTASGIVFRKEKGKEHGELNAEGVAYRPDGSVVTRFSEMLPFDFADQKEADAFAKLPFHYENQLWLPPGQYTIRAVLSPSADAWGKAEQKITVEPRDAGKLSMSGIALSRELRDAKGGVAGLPADMIEGQTPLIASGKEIVPTGSDRFQRGERAFFYTEVYDPALAGANPPQISMRFRVLDRASGAVKSDSGSASIAGYVKAGNPVVGVASTVPETGLGPGAYRLEVTTTHTSGPETVVRSVDFDLM